MSLESAFPETLNELATDEASAKSDIVTLTDP